MPVASYSLVYTSYKDFAVPDQSDEFQKITFCISAFFLFYFLQIFEFGVITFGDKMFTSCPPTPRQFDMLGQTIIAVYWIPAQIDDSDRDSEIFFRMNLANKTELNRTEVEGFIEEINITRNESLVFSDVESVIYITWVNLKQLPGTLAEVSVKYFDFIF